MKKNWAFLYLLASSITFVLIGALCSFGFYGNSVSSAVEKRNFESIYVNTDFDFVAPSPSFDQVEEVESGENGVSKMTPYYSFTTSIGVNGKSVTGNVVLLDDVSKVNFTPYCERRVITGSIPNQGTFAVVDESYAKKNGCNVGDKMHLEINSKSFDFVVTAVSEANTFYDGSVALIIDRGASEDINRNNFKYSAAYVKANNYDLCKTFLEKDYKPLGRLRDRSDFDSDEAYNTHVNNFNSADWSKEITDMRANYNALSIKYENVDSKIVTNTLLASGIVLIGTIGFNLLAINLPFEKKRFKELITKKGGSVSDIVSYNLKGNLYSFAVSAVSLSLFSVIVLLMNGTLNKVGLVLLPTLLPLALLVVGLIFNLVISRLILKRMYSRS